MDFGWTVLSGNNNASTSALNAEARHDEDHRRWLLAARFSGARQTDPTTQDASTTSRLVQFSTEHHRILNEKSGFFVYGKASLLGDEPNGLQQRRDLGVGIGRSWSGLDNTWELHVEGGPSALWTNRVAEAPSGAATARAAIRLDWHCSEAMELGLRSEYFYALDDSETRSGNAEALFRWDLHENWYLQLSGGVVWDGSPTIGFERADFRQALTVGTSF